MTGRAIDSHAAKTLRRLTMLLADFRYAARCRREGWFCFGCGRWLDPGVARLKLRRGHIDCLVGTYCATCPAPAPPDPTLAQWLRATRP